MDNSKWNDLQAIQKRNNSIKEKIQQWKRQRENILSVTSSSSASFTNISTTSPAGFINDQKTNSNFKKIENKLIDILCDKSNNFPIDFSTIISYTSSFTDKKTTKELLIKFSLRKLIQLNEYLPSDNSEKTIFVLSVDCDALKLLKEDNEKIKTVENTLKRAASNDETNETNQSVSNLDDSQTTKKFHSNEKEKSNNDSVECILSLQSTIEKNNQKISEEIQKLLSRPTAKELSLNEQFRSLNPNVQEFCSRGTPEECMRSNDSNEPCERIHFLKIIQKHTDESLGDCSFLNTCFHMDTCKYVHYKVEKKNNKNVHIASAHDQHDEKSKNEMNNQTMNTITTNNNIVKTLANATEQPFKRNLFPAQWIRCDLRFFDMSILGKFAVVMADPPWDIHMELPYGTMSDDEMRNLNIPCLQDEGLIFLWVIGRAMELGRECLKLWGYERCDELIWVKTNQLQRIIRTGRTGHWINHGKEHCLVGVKGNPKNINRSLDCDVIVAEVRATSHKPDEIYGIIERLSPGTRKIELFGRQHNTQPNWVTLGNQLENICLMDPQLIDAYKKCYPEEIINL